MPNSLRCKIKKFVHQGILSENDGIRLIEGLDNVDKCNELKNSEAIKTNYENKPIENTDVVNHPAHYTRNDAMECFDEFVELFGYQASMYVCLFNVWKYRYRAADKNGLEDLKKSDWYMNKFMELKGKYDEQRAGKVFTSENFCDISKL